MAFALFELNDFRSRKAFGKCDRPSRVIKFVTLRPLRRVKQDLQARRQLYLSEHDYVFRTLNCKSVLPDWMVSGPEFP